MSTAKKTAALKTYLNAAKSKTVSAAQVQIWRAKESTK